MILKTKTKTNSHLREHSAPFGNHRLGVISVRSRSDLTPFLLSNRIQWSVLNKLGGLIFRGRNRWRVNDSLEVVDFRRFDFARRRWLALLLANASKGEKRNSSSGGEKKSTIGDKSTTRLRKRFHAYRGERLAAFPRFSRSFFFGDGASGVSICFCNPGHSAGFSPAWWALGFFDLDLWSTSVKAGPKSGLRPPAASAKENALPSKANHEKSQEGRSS